MRATSTDNTGFLLAKAAQRWNELLAERFAREGYGDVRPAYGSVLLPLYEQDGQRLGALTARARVSKQTMTSLIRQMERDDLVERRPDADDGRATMVVLTHRGRAFESVAARILAELDQLVSRAVLRPTLETTRAALKELMSL
jgi:DNA-binding MarR family transcriptional regulator